MNNEYQYYHIHKTCFRILSDKDRYWKRPFSFQNDKTSKEGIFVSLNEWNMSYLIFSWSCILLIWNELKLIVSYPSTCQNLSQNRKTIGDNILQFQNPFL